MAERPLYTLYKGLKANNYDVPSSYDSFEKTLVEAGNGGANARHTLFNSLKSQGYDVPDTYESFYRTLFTPVNKTTSRAIGGDVPMSEADKRRFSAGAANISAQAGQTMQNAGRYNKLKSRQKKQKNDFGRVSIGTHQTPYGGDADNVVKDDFAYNPETGKAGTYVNSDSEDAYNLAEAEQKQVALDQQNQAYQEAVNTGDIPSVFDVRDKNGNYDLQENVGKDGTYVTEEGVQAQYEKKLADAYARKKELEGMIAADNEKNGNPLLSYSASVGAGNGSSQDRRMMDAALNQVKAEINSLEAVTQTDKNAWYQDMQKALENTAFNAKTWDFGINDFALMGQLERIKAKMDQNIPLNGMEQTLLKSKVGADAAAALEDDKMGAAYRWTKIAGQSLPFMADFFLTGGYGGITKATSNAALKFAAKNGMGKLGAAILKNTGVVGADIIGSYAMAGTEQAMKTGADIMQRHMGNLYQDENGNYKFGTFDENGNLLHEGGEDMGKALYKGMTAAMLENYTEKIFGHNYGLKKGALRFMENHGMARSAEFFKNIGQKEWYAGSKKWMEKFGINGFAEEVMEEEINIPLNALLVGDNKASDILDPKQQMDIIGGMALSVGSMYALGAGTRPLKGVYNRAQYYRYKNKVNYSDTDAYTAFGSNDSDKWEALRDKIDNAPNEKMGGVLASIIASRDELTKDQIDAAVHYGINLMKMRGYNLAKTEEMNAKEMTGETATPEEQHDEEVETAYSEGHDAEDADKHNIQMEAEDQMTTLAGMLGITEQQLSGMTDEELDSLTGQDDKLDQAIYDYQLSTARYQGVVDNANDNVEAAAQQASHQTDMLTDKSRGTVRNATVIGINGEEDYGVYIISGKLATHEDGAINIGDSDSMIIYYDPKTQSVEHADARRFVALGDEVPAEEVKAQAIADAKEAAIKAEAGIIDGTVEVGTQFSTTDADGTEHTYEVMADNGDGTAMITIDGNVDENPHTFEELQQLKDAEDLKRLNAAKAQRGMMEEEQKAQEEEKKAQQQKEDEQKNAILEQITNADGNVQLIDVIDENGDTKYPGSQVFLISEDGAKAKIMVMDADGNLKPHAVNKENIVKMPSMTADEYRQTLPASNIEEDRGEIEAEETELEPIGKGAFGNVYDQFKGKVKAAFEFLLKHKGGDLLGVFHRDDVGDIDLVWGDEKMGLAHIIGKHVGEGKDFGSVDDAINKIDEVIKNGAIIQDTENRYVINLDGFRVAIRKNFDGEDKKWIVTAVDYNRSKEEKGITTNPTSASHGASEPELAALNDSDGKGTNNSAENNENNETLTLEDGTVVPMMEDGNPDFSQLTAEQTAELYDSQFGEDAEQIISGFVSEAKKALDKATNMTVKGKNFAEQKASKAEKDKAVADAQTAYDSAKAISDAYAERQLSKETDTHEGRMNLIQKAKNKYSRLKNKDEWKNNPFALWNETVGKVLHRLYDGTSVDVFDHEPQTVEEYVSSNIAPYSLNFEGKENSKGVAAETGLQRKDFTKSRVLAAEGKGKTVDEFVHKLWDDRPKQLEIVSDQEIRNALLSLITSDMNAYDMSHVIEDNRIAQAEEELENNKRAAENAAFEEEQRKAAEEEAKKKEEEAKKQAEAAAKVEEEEKNAATAEETGKLDEEMADANDEYEHLAPSYNFENDENLSEEERENMVLREGDTFAEYRNRNGVDANGTTTPLGIKVARAYIQQKYGDKLADIDAIFGMSMKDHYDGWLMAEQMMKIVDADMNDFDAALMMRNDNVPLRSEAIQGYLDGAAELIKARHDAEKLGLAAFDSEGNPVYKSIVELANWAKEQGLELDGESAASNYANLYLACKDGFGATTLVPDQGDYINMVFYFPEQLKGQNGEVNQERLRQMADEFNEGRDALHSAEADIELTDGAQFYNGDTAREFRDFVDKKTEEENKPFGEQIDESELPFSIKGKDSSDEDENKVLSPKERKKMVNNNSTTRKDVIDTVIGKDLRKSINAIAKKMGVNVQFLLSADQNGWFDRGTNTLYLALNTRQAMEMLFGHEMTHVIKSVNEAYYNEFRKIIRGAFPAEEYEKGKAKYREAYANVAGYNTDADYEEELIADEVGKLIHETNYAHTLAFKMSHPLLSIFHKGILDYIDSVNGTDYESPAITLLRSVEQAYLATAKGNFASSASGERFSLRDEEVAEANDRFNNEIEDFKNKSHKGLMHLGAPSPILRASGVNVDEITLSPKVLNKKLNQHSLTTDDVKDLVNAIQTPIMVYKHGKAKPNIVVITNAEIRGNKLSIALELDADGNVTELNNVSSIHDKDADKEVERLLDFTPEEFKEAMKWCDKEKVLDWISSARLFSHMQTENSQGLSLAKVINDFENPAIEGEDLTNNNENVKYSLRQKEEPKKKGIGYKVFLLGKDGKLYPPMVANPNGAATPVGVWLDADAAPIAGESKTGRPQVKQGGKGTQGGSGKLAYRPGWHLGVIPYALQFNRKDAEGNKTLFPKNFVFAEVEYAADVDYQQEAHDAGINPSGKYQHSLAGLKHLPTDGYYMYRTNPNPETDPWVITGAMKVNRILTRAEQAELVKKAGREPQMIQDGDIVTDEIVNSINQEIANAPKFSIKTYHGSQASFDHFDHSFMGSGEGAQAYGWGTYVSEVEGIARSYAKQNARKHKGSMELFDIESKLSHEEWDRAIMDTRYKNTLKDIEYQTKNRAKKQAMLDEELKDRPRLAQTYGENSDVVKDSDKIISQLQTIVNRAEQTLVELAERKKNIENDLANSDKKLADLKARLAAIPKPERNLYTVDIPDDNGDNYIDWDGSLSENAAANIAKGLVEKNIDAAIDMLYKYGNFIVKDDVNKLHDRKNEINKEKLAERIGKAISSYRGGAVYKDLAKVLGGQKNASLMLKDAGIDGVKVIAQRNTGGNKDGRMNYVIFDENNANIVNHEKFSLKNAKPVRFEVGKSLSEEEKKEVLATLKDAYKENNVSFHTEESANGKERRVYEPTADDYVKSDITGRALRYYITLPDGRIAHPTEVYPNISNNEVETSLKKRDVLGDEVKELIDGKVKKLKESASDIEKATAILTQLQDLEHETTDVGYGLDNPQSYNYKTGVFTSNANQAIDYVVRRMRRKEEVPADVVEAVKTAVKNSYGMVDNLLDGITSDSAPKTFEEFLESPSLKFQIRNEEQRKAAESAYNWAVENRPDKWKQYALVNMANPQQMPEYYEKKALADKWRRYENKVGVGARRVITDFKLFDLNKPFEENVVNVKGKVPEEFDPHKFEKNREEIAAINKQKKELNEKLNALEEVRRKRMNDILKQYMDEHNLSSENEVPDDVWMGSRRTANDEYTAEADKVVEQIQELNKKLKSLSGNDVRFSLKDEKTLAGVHNITEEKLLKAIKMGGLANPSVAVIDFIKQKHEEYGDISLILPSDKVAKRTGKNAGTWQGDAWTPTYPQIERQMSNNGAEKASKDISSVPSDMYSEVKRGVDRWLDSGEANSVMAYMYLHEKGVAPEPKKIQHKFSDEAYKELKNITAGDFNIYGIGKADTKKVLDMYIEAKFDGDKSLYEEKTKAWLERNKSIVDAGTKGGMRYAIAKENVELYNKYGFNYKGVQTFVRDVEYDHRKTGVDTNATLNEVEDYIKTNNLTDEFNNWLEGKEKEYGIKEVIFDGFTPSGNRRYVPNTLENVSKIMKKQGRNGATGTAVSFQNFAARLMPSYGTLKDIRSRKDLLTSDREEFDKFREKWANVFYELGMKCQPDATGTFDDYGLARLSEAAMTSDPQAYLKKEYNVDFSDEDTKLLKEMVKAIKEEHPAMYFETKFERPVGFDEFSSAVVPTTASNEVKQALQNAGVQIYEYDKQKEGDRSRAFNEAINSSDNIRFSLRYDQFEHDLNQWKKDNGLKKDAQRPAIPTRDPGESAVDFMKKVNEYRRQMALWKTAPTYEGHLLTDGTAQGEFNRELQRGSVLKRIAFQDSMLAIRKAQEAIMKEYGVDKISMAEDAYTAENRSHGKGKNELEEYNDEFLQPLRKAYKKMKDLMDGSYDNVKVYMMAKHGLERNAQMAFKKALENDFENVDERVAVYNGYKADVARMQNDADLNNGKIDYATWRQRDNGIRTKYAPSYPEYRYDKDGNIMDYSGLTALFEGTSDIEVAASDLVKNAEDKYSGETADLWNAVNAATKKILRDSYKAGMMSEKVYEYVRDMYKNYIPLRGWNETQADQVWDYIGGGKGAFNQTLKEANGRTSIADDPIAYIENMAESGILINNKNWVKQHLMLLAENHPTSLLTLSKAWYVKSTDAAGNETWIPASPQITSGMTNQQVEAAVEAFQKKMEKLEETGDATQQRGHLEITYPQTGSEEREHEVRVMKDGEEYVIYVNGDPQLAQAMNNTRAHRVREVQSGKLDRACAWLGRKMAAAYTSLSPLFIPSNYFRDLTMTLASTAIREDGRYNYLLRKNLATSWNMWGLLKGYKDGTLREKVRNGNATEKEQMFYDFMMNGGETGFVSSFDVEDLKKKFKGELQDMDRWAANPKKVLHTIYDSIEFMNRAIENSNRFAVYMTSIQYGRSIEEAVNNAKDVTLNFNRKGTGENGWQMIRNLFLFINPAVQSLQTLGALAKHHPYKFTAVTSAWMASGVLVPLLNVGLMQIANLMVGAMGGDDDDEYKDIDKKYWQFSKWDRRNNLIMWVPFTKEFVKIPLAQEFRGFYAVGDMIASKLLGGDTAKESWGEYAEDLMGQVVDMLPLDPTGYDGNIAVSLMPNAVRPMFELAFNVDFTGKPLFKDSEYNKYDPNFTKAYAGTPDWLVRVSRMVNSIGNDYPDVQQNKIDAFGDPRYNLNNPAVADHVLSSYLGGAYTMGSQVMGVLTKALNDPKEIKVADIPLVSKFVSNPEDRPVAKKQGDEFWTMKENHDRVANTLSKLKKKAKVDGDYSLLEQLYGSEEYKQYKLDDAKVKKYEEDKKKEKAEETGEEYKPHQRTADDVYKEHSSANDELEDLKMKQIYSKLNSFKTSYDLLVKLAPKQSDDYYQKHKVAIDAVNAVELDKKDISDTKKDFLTNGVVSYDAEKMQKIRGLRKKVLEVLEKANKEVIAEQQKSAQK